MMSSLATATVADVPLKHPKVIVLDSNMNVGESLGIFVSNAILSAPVYDEASQKFLGFMDMMDIVRFLVETFGENTLRNHQDSTVLTKNDAFCGKKIVDILGDFERNPFLPVTQTASLEEVIKHFTKGGQYIRRVAVIDNTKTGKESLVSIVSQFALLNHISKTHSYHPDKAVLVGDLYAKNKTVVSIEGGQTALHAFQLMSSENVSGIAVSDDCGRLIGSLSIRDLKGLISDKSLLLSRLLIPARSFVNLISQMSILEKHPAVSVLPKDTFSSAIDKMCAAGIHRLFVVNDKLCAVGVFSLTDMLHGLVNQSSK